MTKALGARRKENSHPLLLYEEKRSPMRVLVYFTFVFVNVLTEFGIQQNYTHLFGKFIFFDSKFMSFLNKNRKKKQDK